VWTVHPLPQDRLEVRVLVVGRRGRLGALALAQDERVPDRHAAHPGPDEHEGVDAVRVRQREVDGGTAAEGEPDQRGRLHPECGEQVVQVLGKGEVAGLRRGPAVPAGVVPDRPVTRANQERDLFVPQRVVEHSAMQQYDRTAIAFHVVEQLSAAHLRGTGRHRWASPC